MRISILLLLSILSFTGCTSKTAFEHLNISKDEELAMENTKCGKISSQDLVDGIYTVIYLSNIYKDEFKGKHVFYVSLFLKSGQDQLNITLNGANPSSLEELKEDNKYTKLLSMHSVWTKHYLVSFKDTKQEKLNFSIDNGQFSSGQLNYSKE